MATAGLADIHNNSCWGRTVMKKTLTAIGWRSAPDPTDKMMDDKGPVLVLAEALELMSGLDARTQPSVGQGNGLQLSQTKKARAG